MKKIYIRSPCINLTEPGMSEKGYFFDEHKDDFVHRIVYEEAFGPIPRRWVVHHINFNKVDNSLENLIALPDSFHNYIHKKMKETKIKYDRKYIEYLLKDYCLKQKPNYQKYSALLGQVKKLQKEIKKLKSDHIAYKGYLHYYKD